MPPPSPLPTFVYKILATAPPNPLPAVLTLSPLDASDGFIHLSTAAQTPATAARFFRDHEKLWLLRIPLLKLEDGRGEVRWEDTRNHGCFAHLYGGDIGSANVDEVVERERGELGWEKVLEGLMD